MELIQPIFVNQSGSTKEAGLGIENSSYSEIDIFDRFKNENFTCFSKIQNYIPIYKNFFKLNEKNFNTINLNHKYHIECIDQWMFINPSCPICRKII